MKPEELEKLRHENRMEETEAERKAKMDVERLRHDNAMSEIRLKTANMRAVEQSKRYT